MDKKFIYILILTAFIGGIFGSIISANFAKANILENFYNSVIKPFFPQSQINQEQVQTQNQQISDQPIVPYQATINYEQAVISAVEKASPAVVSIIISKDVPIIERCPYNPFADLPQEFQQFFGGGFELYQPCQKGTQKQEVGGGTGFIISSDGMILTNKHVVSVSNASYTVLTNEGKRHDAKVIAQDPTIDLAIIKIETGGLSVLNLGDSDSVKLGQTAIAIGNALGEFRNTVSVGVISGLARNIVASSGGTVERIEGVLQTDTAINQGNSGGPLLNLRGEVIGINVAMVSGAQSIGFAIPINQAKRAIESVKRTGKIISPFLGVRYVLISPDLAKKENLPVEYGALIRGAQNEPGVLKNSSAEKAGLKEGDIIVEINGMKISVERSLASILQKYNVGDTITLKVLRDNSELNLKATLTERP